MPTISNSDATQGDVGQVKVVCLGTDDPTCNGTSCGARPKLVSRARVAGVSRGAAGDCLTLPRILNFELLAVRRGFFSICNFSAKQATHNNQHDTHHPMDVTTVARSGVETRAGKRTRERDAHAGEAIPGLPLDVVVSHVLREENLPDPTDLAWLRTVSRAMCDAVAATGRRIENLDDTWVAANRGWLSTLKRLHRRGVRFDAQVCCIAAKGGHLEVLQWLRENSCPWDWETCLWAAMHGHLKVLQWARANGCPWDAKTCASAAEGGHLGVLQWARTNGYPWDATTCSGAAREGLLEVRQWARANGCQWNERTCALAAREGHLELLQWLRANGCPWDETTCALAAESGYLEVLNWVAANGCPERTHGV